MKHERRRCRPVSLIAIAELGNNVSNRQWPWGTGTRDFFAQHGSWNRTVPIGARVCFASLKPDGTGDKAEVFAEGWLNDKGAYDGHLVDVAQLPDGSLLVSDDYAGALYRITYDEDEGAIPLN